jgi:predicted O-methyltransferase YrrM
MIRPEHIYLLYRYAKDIREGCIVEVGSYRGRSTAAISMGAAHGFDPPVFAIEPHEPFQNVLGGSFGPADRAAFYRTMLRTGSYKNVRLVNVSSEIVSEGWTLAVGMLWIDGDHTYEGVAKDYASWKPHLTKGAIAIFDDVWADLGPGLLVSELVSAGEAHPIELAGKVQVLRVI